jgi:hypothetical protein
MLVTPTCGRISFQINPKTGYKPTSHIYLSHEDAECLGAFLSRVVDKEKKAVVEDYITRTGKVVANVAQ